MREAAVLGIAAVAALSAHAGGRLWTSPEAALETALGQIRPELIRAHMRFLADDLLEGRGTGTRGHRLAALYVATQLEGLGLEPAGDEGTYFQAMRLARARPRERECSLVLVADGQERALAYGTDFVMVVDPTGPDAVLRAPVAFVGYGVTAPEEGYDDYAAIDVRGRIVAFLGGSPPSFADAPGAFFADQALKRHTAARHGAAGVVQLSLPGDGSDWDATVADARPGAMALADAGNPAPPPRAPDLAHLSRSGAAALFGSESGPLQDAVADVKAGKPHSFATTRELSVRQRTERSELDSANVVGVLRGADTKIGDESVVYTAHLDHLGIGEPVGGDAIYNGARDNASGVAGLLAVARAFASLASRPRRSILFLATTAEEPGWLGSCHFVNHPTLPLHDIVAGVNLDGLAVFWPLQDVAGWGARHSTLGGAVEEAARRLGLEATLPDRDSKVLVGFSDQAPFAKKGIPVVWLVYGDKSPGGGVDPAALERKWARAHQPDDDMRQPFDFDSSVKLSQAAFLTGYLVANDGRRPSWRDGDFFAERFGRRR
jgi:Zn-dependent M28 family amino/carboxypeptidase